MDRFMRPSSSDISISSKKVEVFSWKHQFVGYIGISNFLIKLSVWSEMAAMIDFDFSQVIVA